jgi:hypothetical protein
MLVALGTLTSAQANGTEATVKACNHLFNYYCAAHPNAVIRYTTSGMILHLHSDASYLSKAKARSRAGSIFFLSIPLADPTHAPEPTNPPPPTNGTLHILSSIMPMVLSSATEAELGPLFYNAKDACMLHTTLSEMGHPQHATPIQTNNAIAAGITNDTVKQCRSKAIEM